MAKERIILKIIVCVKQVPDTAAEIAVEDGKISWGDAPLIINPWDEFAVEAALDLKAEHGGEVIALSLGKEEEIEAIQHALAMGADKAVLVSDPDLRGVDTIAVSQVLGAAVNKIGGVDLVLFGQQSVNTTTGLLPVQVARQLDWPSLSLVSRFVELSAEDGSLTVVRVMEEGSQVVTSELPNVISITKEYGKPRYPSFMGIRKASRAAFPTWNLSDLELVAPKSAVSRLAVIEPPERAIITEMIPGDTPQEKAHHLVQKLIEAKVI